MTNESYPEKIGRYQILSLLGEGAMAKVFKAVDTRIDRVVALKMLQFREGMTDEMIQQLKDRFVHEAKFAGKLTHPNIVTIYDAEEENGVSYMAMEYVDGRTLESVIENNETLTVEQILDILIQLAHGLDYAHKHDIIHRDIKPGNIILTSEDIPKIMDFGIAKITTSSTTVIGTILGTPGYMSPEQITGKSVDHRTDIFALGAVFYELLTREKAFPGKNLTEIMYRVVSENPMPPSMVNLNVPEIINSIVMRAIAKGPGERYQSGTEFAKALEATKKQLSSGGHRTTISKSAPPSTDKKTEIVRFFENRYVGMVSFGWATLATILLLITWSGGFEFSRMARSLSEKGPASLIMNLNVPDAEIMIDGDRYTPQSSLFRLDSVGVGERRITVKRDHYESYETAVIFGKGEQKNIEVHLKPLPVEIPPGSDTSFVTIRSSPDMVKVETSYGKFLGFTPIDSLIFPGGRYTLIFSREDFISRKRDIALGKKRLTYVEQSLEKQRGTVSLDQVFPEQSYLMVNGRRVQKNYRNNSYVLPVGNQVLTIKADGYDDLVKTLRVEPDSVLVLTDSLKAQWTSVRFESNPTGADVYLDGSEESAGKTPVIVNELLANSHKLRAVLRNEKRLMNFRAVKGDTATVRVVFANPNGYLNLVSDPPGAEIFLNTVRDGDYKTPVKRELKPGFYKVRLTHPSFKKYHEITVRVRPDFTTELVHKFEP